MACGLGSRRSAVGAISRWGETAAVPAVVDLPTVRSRSDRGPSLTHRALAVAAAMTLVVGLAAVVAARPDPSPVAAAEGEWAPMAAGPLSARQEPNALWSGTEVIIWGGWDGAGQILTDGARYDPRRDRWAPMAAPPDNIGWVGPSAFVQGRAAYVVYPEVGELDWRLITYDPAADAWATVIVADLTHLPSDLLPSSQDLHGAPKQVAVSGDQVLFGVDQAFEGATSAWGFRIDVPGLTAQPIRPPTPTNQVWHGQVGVSDDVFVRVGTITSGQGQSRRVAHRLADDGIWEEVEPPFDGWSVDNQVGELVTTPLGLLVLGGHDLGGSYGGLTSDGGTRLAAAPEVDRWKELPEPPIDPRRARFATVWTGKEVIVWGGSLRALPIDGDGARFIID